MSKYENSDCIFGIALKHTINLIIADGDSQTPYPSQKLKITGQIKVKTDSYYRLLKS